MKQNALRLLLWVAIIVLGLPAAAQHFAHHFPNTNLYLNSAIPLSNGDILVCGQLTRPAARYSAFAMRLDGAGQVKWAKIRNDTAYSAYAAVEERPAGQGYVLAGWCEVNPSAEYNRGLVALMDTSGNLTNLHFPANSTQYNRIRQMPNGDYHFGGSVLGFFTSNPPLYLRSNASLIPQQYFTQWAALSVETGGRTEPTADGWFSMANARDFNGNGIWQMAFSRQNPAGAGSFYRYYNYGSASSGKASCQLASGDHLYLGDATVSGQAEMVLMRLNPVGNVLSAKQFRLNPVQPGMQASSMELSQPDSVLIWGTRIGGSWLCSADTLGNIGWMRTYALGSTAVTIRSVRKMANGDLLMTAQTNAGPLLLRTDATGGLLCPGMPALGSLAGFTSAAITVTSSSFSFGSQTNFTDSIPQYSVLPLTMSVTDACNAPCVDSIVAQSSPLSPCVGQSANFCNNSPFASSTIWTFNGNPAGTTSCITIAFNGLGGTDTLTLTSVINACTTTTTRIIQVGVPTPASFVYSANQLAVAFSNTTAQPFTTVSWNFGDGNSSTNGNPTHTYAAPGTYNVCMMVLEPCGWQTQCQSVTVTCPSAQAQFTTALNSLNATFTTNVLQGTPTGYVWDFGDGATSTLMNPSHSYSAVGSYAVCLTTSSLCGSSTWCDTIQVTCLAPSSSWTSTDSSLVWTFSSTPAGPYPVAYLWDFGDGNGSTLANPQHTYASPGNYVICLTATSLCGSTQTCQSTAVNAAPPILSFTANGNRYAWNFTSNVIGYGPFTYAWTFGNGLTSSLANPSIMYTAPGTYTVCLTVTDVFGASSTSCTSITVVCPMPIASMSYSAQGNLWSFQSQTSGTQGMGWMWDFGDGGSSNLPNPSHLYAQSGQYDVCLVLTDSCGADTVCETIAHTAVGLAMNLPVGVKIWPVPAHNNFQIEGIFNGELSIHDMQGRLLYQRTMDMQQGEPFVIDVSNWPKAMYVLELRNAHGVWLRKIPIQ